MDEINTYTIIVSVASSIAAAGIISAYLKIRAKHIRSKIEEINTHEEYLEKLAKGNIKLLRTSFTLLFIILAGFCVAFSTAVLAFLLGSGFMFYKHLLGFSSWLFVTGAFLCVFQVRAIIHSADLKSAKVKLNEKRLKLESKIT